MRALTLTAFALGMLFSQLPAQELTGVEPGVFIYSWDETNGYTRDYYPSQADARQAVSASYDEAMTAVTNLKQMANINLRVQTEAVAEWLIFCEQWHYWQEWVIEEYELGDVFMEHAGSGGARFAAVPGTQLRHEQDDPSEQAIANAATGRGAFTGGGGKDAAFGGLEGGFEGGGFDPGAGGAADEVAAADQAAVNLDNFAFLNGAPTTEAEQELIITTIHGIIDEMVKMKAMEHVDDLSLILADIDYAQERRRMRQAAIAARQREVSNLRNVILEREAAQRVEIDGQTYLFSETPLQQRPGEDLINIQTPNLTPYDMFDQQGSPRVQ